MKNRPVWVSSDDQEQSPGLFSAPARWAGWQQAHQQALESLQAAEAAYHRLTVEQAFGRGDDEASRATRMEALTHLDEQRIRLDEIREQRPPWPD